jgi:hypothetical protein
MSIKTLDKALPIVSPLVAAIVGIICLVTR